MPDLPHTDDESWRWDIINPVNGSAHSISDITDEDTAPEILLPDGCGGYKIVLIVKEKRRLGF